VLVSLRERTHRSVPVPPYPLVPFPLRPRQLAQSPSRLAPPVPPSQHARRGALPGRPAGAHAEALGAPARASRTQAGRGNPASTPTPCPGPRVEQSRWAAPPQVPGAVHTRAAPRIHPVLATPGVSKARVEANRLLTTATNPIGVFPTAQVERGSRERVWGKAPPPRRPGRRGGHAGTPTTSQGGERAPSHRTGRRTSREPGARKHGPRRRAGGGTQRREHLHHREDVDHARASTPRHRRAGHAYTDAPP
jgi:hypothetical protein